jgi:hypothetical protein
MKMKWTFRKYWAFTVQTRSQSYRKDFCLQVCDALALSATDISGERIASIIRLTRISELGTTIALTNN